MGRTEPDASCPELGQQAPTFPKPQLTETSTLCRQDCSKRRDLTEQGRGSNLHSTLPAQARLLTEGRASPQEPWVLSCHHLLIHLNGMLPRQTGLKRDVHCCLTYICEIKCKSRAFLSAWSGPWAPRWFLWPSRHRASLLQLARAHGISKSWRKITLFFF